VTGHKLETVLAWHEALNAGDADRVASSRTLRSRSVDRGARPAAGRF